MNSRLLPFMLVFGLLLPYPVDVLANDVNGAVKVSVQQDREIWAGQQITLNLDLKTTGFSFSDTYFNLPDIGNAFLMQTDSTTVKLTEKSGGQDWQILRYPLALFPQQSGRLVIPPIEVRFSSSLGYGTEIKSFQFKTESLELDIKLPPGVNKDEMLVTSSSFQLDHQWQPESEIVKTGDAFTLTVKRTAGDISAMLLPPLPQFSTEGLAVYPQTPRLEDKSNRGSLVGERIDSITWVIEKPGSYKIPGIRFQWWDPQSQELNQQVVPGIRFDANPSSQHNTAETNSTDAAREPVNIGRWLFLVVAGLITLGLWARFRPEATGENTPDEKSAFNDLKNTLGSGNAGRSYSAIHAWLAFFPSKDGHSSGAITLQTFAQIVQDDQLALELLELQQAVVSQATGWSGANLLTSLGRARRKLKKSEVEQTKPGLAPLNPL